MLEAPIPADEVKRLALLAACNIIYTPAEQAFDDVARLAAELCGTEIALITLVDSDYQWFKARVGVELVGTPRDLSFCGHCINGHHPLIVEDTLRDRALRRQPAGHRRPAHPVLRRRAAGDRARARRSARSRWPTGRRAR